MDEWKIEETFSYNIIVEFEDLIFLQPGPATSHRSATSSEASEEQSPTMQAVHADESYVV